MVTMSNDVTYVHLSSYKSIDKLIDSSIADIFLYFPTCATFVCAKGVRWDTQGNRFFQVIFALKRTISEMSTREFTF